MSLRADFSTLRSLYPRLHGFFDALTDTTYPLIPAMSLVNAIVRVVNSQMLSTQSASAIFARIQAQARGRRRKILANLSADELRECGMSKSKIRTIHEFRDRYRKDPQRYERWREMSFDELLNAVDEVWGISTWTAEMLAIFYFGHKDVFPSKDLSINNGVALIRVHLDGDFFPETGNACSTLLARCIWRSFEVGYWNAFEKP